MATLMAPLMADGACFNREARVLMADGSSKAACDVEVGDVLADGAGESSL